MDKLRCYIATVKDRFHPSVSSSAALLLERHYQRCREQRNVTIHVTVRFFESLIRLSQAHARLMHRDVVTISDAAAVILLMESSALKCGGLNPSFSSDSHGLIFCEPLHSDFPDSDEADELFLQDQTRLLHLYGMIECIPKEDRRETSTLLETNEALIDKEVSEIYQRRNYLGEGNTQQNYSQVEDSWGRKFWNATPPSQQNNNNCTVGSNNRRRDAD